MTLFINSRDNRKSSIKLRCSNNREETDAVR